MVKNIGKSSSDRMNKLREACKALDRYRYKKPNEKCCTKPIKSANTVISKSKTNPYYASKYEYHQKLKREMCEKGCLHTERIYTKPASDKNEHLKNDIRFDCKCE